jgi:phosphonate transport system substrate-binding protein
MGCAKAIYAGSHTASFEAIYNHKVDAGELNSEQLESATQRGHYKDGDVVFLWKSDPIPTDPFAVRGDLPDGLKKKLTEAVQHLDLMNLDRPTARFWSVPVSPKSCRKPINPMT